MDITMQLTCRRVFFFSPSQNALHHAMVIYQFLTGDLKRATSRKKNTMHRFILLSSIIIKSISNPPPAILGDYNLTLKLHVSSAFKQYRVLTRTLLLAVVEQQAQLADKAGRLAQS